MARTKKAEKQAEAKAEANGEEKKRPVKSFRYQGGIKLSVWSNVVPRTDGSTREAFSVTWSRTYKDPDGQWKDSQGLWPEHLLTLSHGLHEAYRYIAEQEAIKREAARNGEEIPF